MNSDSLNMVSRLGEGHMPCIFFLSEPQLKTTVGSGSAAPLASLQTADVNKWVTNKSYIHMYFSLVFSNFLLGDKTWVHS